MSKAASQDIYIEERVFYLNSISYVLKWAKERHLKEDLNKIQNIGDKLLKFYDICSSSQYPEAIFKDKSVARCSDFRIKYLERNSHKPISIRLVNNKIVESFYAGEESAQLQKKYGTDLLSLPKAANIWHTIFSNTMKTVGHDPILDKILKLNQSALAIEVPIWSSPPNEIMANRVPNTEYQCSALDLFTGHIDLLLFDKKSNNIIVADYKPENHLLKSLPQVAIYGLTIKKMFGIENVKCMSFSREKAWIYDPEIIRIEIQDYLRRYGNPKLDWQPILLGL